VATGGGLVEEVAWRRLGGREGLPEGLVWMYKATVWVGATNTSEELSWASVVVEELKRLSTVRNGEEI
jgi:hypothetical protein